MTTFRSLMSCALIACTAAGPTKVMPLGDSITFGCGDQCEDDCMVSGFFSCSDCAQGWRGPLWRKLAGESKTSADWVFVGTQLTGSGTMDMAHEGHAGWTSEQILNISDTWVPFQPDVILLHLGTNNLGIAAQDASTALTHMRDLLDTIFARLPEVRLLLSTLIGSSDVNYAGLEHAAYNEGIIAFAREYASSGFDVDLVDMDKESGIGQYCDDTNCCPMNIHPNNLGYVAMANVWYSHLINQASSIV